MPRSISRLASMLLVPLAVCAFASSTHAAEKKQPKDVKTKCEDHIKNKFKASHPDGKVALTPTREWQPTSTQNGIGGTGVLTQSNKKQLSFEWSCVYDTKTNKIVDADHTKLTPIATPKTETPKTKK